MIENWIDDLCAAWEIAHQRFSTVKSHKLVDGADFPSAINAAELDVQPIALTFIETFKPEYSVGGPKLGFYTGQTEIHVAPDMNKARLPQLMPWFGMIANAAAAKMKLNNKVEYFVIADREDAISLKGLQYGDENPHWGFVVYWLVKERLNDLTVSA